MTTKTTTPPRTIDITPTWVGILPLLLLCFENGGETRETARAELIRMAKIADAAVAASKAEGV